MEDQTTREKYQIQEGGRGLLDVNFTTVRTSFTSFHLTLSDSCSYKNTYRLNSLQTLKSVVLNETRLFNVKGPFDRKLE